MADLDKNQHNHLEAEPVVKKTVVDTVLGAAISAGNSLVSLVAGLLATVLIVYSGYVVADTFITQERAKSSSWDLLKFKPEIIEDNETPLSGSALSGVNRDYRAWLSIYDTNIDYPVVQGPDDLYYASHDIYKRSSLTGAIYLAAGNSPDFSDSYNLIYGHHMDGAIMFGSLDQYRDAGFLQGHRSGILVTGTEVYDLDFFAAASTDAYEGKIYSVGNRADDVLAFLRDPAGGVGVGTQVITLDDPGNGSKIIALSTCASSETSGRLVIFGTMTRRNLLSVTIPDYEGIYDGEDHFVTAQSDHMEGTTFEYSTDGGKTWTADPPVIRNVGSMDVMVRAFHPEYGSATAAGTLTVHPRMVVLRSGSAQKEYDGSALVSHRIMAEGDGFVPGEGADYDVTGSQLLVGSSRNDFTYTLKKGTDPGNYLIRQEYGMLTVTPPVVRYTIHLVPNGDETSYDGEEHSVSGLRSTEFLINGHFYTVTGVEAGVSGTDAGSYPVEISGTAVVWDEYGNDVTDLFDVTTGEAELVILPAQVIVMAEDQIKEYGQTDPPLTAIVDGLFGDDTIVYTLSRNAGEEPGEYEIIPEGEEFQGNYEILYVPATLTIYLDPVTAQVTKVWDDAQNFTGKRPDQLVVTLSNGEQYVLNEENDWSVIVMGLPKYVDGEPAVYTWSEPEVEGYDTAGPVNTVVDGSVTTIFTNQLSAEEGGGVSTVSTVVWVWDDDGNRDGVRPDSVTVTFSNGETVILNEDNHWTFTMEDLPKIHSYTWTAPEVEGYTVSAPVVSGTVTTFTALHTPAVRTLSIRKVWEDENDADGIRPDQLPVTLTGNGTAAGTVVLSAENGWSGSIADVPANKDGSPVVYTWTEPSVPGYGQTEAAVRADETTLTNTHVPQKEPAEDNVTLTIAKVWDDNNNAQRTRPSAVTMFLMGGSTVHTVTLTAADEWTRSVTVPRTEDGAEVAYSWVEESVSGYTQTAMNTTGHLTVVTNARTQSTPVTPVSPTEPSTPTTPQTEATQRYTLTIHYRYLNGDTAAPVYTASLAPGTAYDVASPLVKGYSANLLRATGTMPERAVEYTVLYLPGDNLIAIDDYTTPLGIDDDIVNVGDCFE